MNRLKTVHTSVTAEAKKRLMEFGRGYLNTGIYNLIEIADSKTIIVIVETQIIFQNHDVTDGNF